MLSSLSQNQVLLNDLQPEAEAIVVGFKAKGVIKQRSPETGLMCGNLIKRGRRLSLRKDDYRFIPAAKEASWG